MPQQIELLSNDAFISSMKTNHMIGLGSRSNASSASASSRLSAGIGKQAANGSLRASVSNGMYAITTHKKRCDFFILFCSFSRRAQQNQAKLGTEGLNHRWQSN